MINLYLIDYYSDLKNNGLHTYIQELSYSLQLYPEVQLHHIWIKSPIFQSFYVEKLDKITHIHMPVSYSHPSKAKDFDSIVSGHLIANMRGKENLIVHFNWINHCSFAWHLKQKVKCKTVLTKHCIPWRDWITTNYQEFYKLNSAFVNKESYSINNGYLKKEQIDYESIDHFITVTAFAKQNLQFLFKIPDNRISVIYNGIRAGLLKPGSIKKKDQLRKKYGYSINEKLIIFAGSVNKRKGVVDLARTFERLSKKATFKNVRLIVAGSGDYNILLTSLKSSWSKITITGNLTKEVLYDHYMMADIGIIPSYVEQCSYTAIEMMYSGLPLIVSDIDGLKEMVDDQSGLKVKLLLDENTGASICSIDLEDKLTTLICNPGLAGKLSKNARKNAKVRFCVQKMVTETLEIYQNSKVEMNKVNQEANNLISVSDIRNKPLVSIVLPCFNAGKYLADCLADIKNQSYSNFELIVIDDGSSDETENIIKDHQNDRRIKYHKKSRNTGIVDSLNKGIDFARGKYIARMDADDRMKPNRLALQVDFLENNPDFGMVGAWHEVIDQYGKICTRVKNLTDSELIKLGLLFNNQFAHSAVTVRSELIKKLKYDANFQFCEDYELWTRVATISKTANLPHYLLSYRLHGNNTSDHHADLQKQSVMMLLSRELDQLGVQHSIEELALHSAICFGYKVKYFNTTDRKAKLNSWLDRIFLAESVKNLYQPERLAEFRKHVVKGLCGLHEN